LILVGAAFASFMARPAEATFHEMQIEQVIGGVNGNTSAQAIQLRMRATGQNFVSQGRLRVSDAAGANPILLIDFTTDVASGNLGDRVLAATSAFANATATALTPDFILTNPIPASYLAAGSLTYETDTGFVLWRLSWGGAGYTGSGNGLTTNDVDGNFNPPFPGSLPSTSAQALLFQNAATAPSTNNAADYALTPGAAVFTNNAGAGATVSTTAGVDGPGRSALQLSAPAPDPVSHSMMYRIALPRDMRVRVNILDVGGRVVRALADQEMSAGPHELSWSAGRAGAALPDGLYFLELDAGGELRTQRFVLMR
jgi:hypothetical protein